MFFVEKTKGLNYFKQFDYFLFICVLLLSAIGILALYSATLSKESGPSTMAKQAIMLGIGIILAIIISSLDYKSFKTIGIVFYLVSIVLLVYVIFKGTGASKWGSNSWIRIGGFSFQPSEIAKITFVIVVSTFLERIKEGQEHMKKNIAKVIIYSAIPILLVMLQKDFGTSIVFIFMFFVMIFISGIPYKYIFGSIVASVPCALYIWFFQFNDKRRNRILYFLNPEADGGDAGFQILRSIRAIGSGKIFGKGLFKGVLTQKGAVPVNESDFIFTVIGEELGFIGSSLVVIVIFALLMRCMYIAKNSRDPYGTFVVVGLTAMMGFHFIENIGMNISILPITGIPLPFFSQGGSAMLTNYIAIGIILSVSMRRKRTIFNSSQ